MSKQIVIARTEGEKTAVIGSPVRRVEDLTLITGEGKYVGDIKVSNCLFVALVRSTYPHANIRSIDSTKALPSPGVVAIFTGKDLKQAIKPVHNIEPLPFLKSYEVYPLAVEKVRYVGEPVAAIVATSENAAKDAVELVSVDYEPLLPIVDPEAALSPQAPVVYEKWGNNLMLHYKFSVGEIDRAFEQADVIVEERISVHRHSPMPIETNCYLANYERSTGLILWASTQQPHLLRTIVSETLGLPENDVRVIQPDVGGGFGEKCVAHHEEILVSFLSVRLGRPVKYVEDRKEHLTASHQAREQIHYVKMAVKRNGEILALKDRIIGNLGTYFPNAGPSSFMTAARFVPGCYKIKNYEVEVLGAATNKPAYGSYRGFGKDAANYVIERTIELAARRLEMDSIEFRKKNLIQLTDFPFRSVTGSLYDRVDYLKNLEKALTLARYNELRALQAREHDETESRLGVGISVVIDPASPHHPNTMALGYDGSRVRLEPSGRVSVFTGITSAGTGTRTTFGQIAADELGVRFEDVSVFQGDTSETPFGYGMWASRSTVTGGNSVMLASRKLRARIISIASHLLNEEKEYLEVSRGVVHSTRKDDLKISIRDVAAAFYRAAKPIPPHLIEEGLEVTAYYVPSNLESLPNKDGVRNVYSTYGNSVCVCVVRTDIETGVVKVLDYFTVVDEGRIINPVVLEGQVHGGVVQAIGGTVYEENLYDAEGQPLATTFMDYLIPTACESPWVTVSLSETRSIATLLGAKGAGEGPVEGVYAALTNAVEDSLKVDGVQINELPLTPERVWRLRTGHINANST